MVMVRQGYNTMSPMAKDFEARLRNKELAMNNNPVMNWMISCTEIISDPAQNIKPVKPPREKSGKRIDGVISSIMALARAVADEQKPSIYESQGLATVDITKANLTAEKVKDDYEHLRKRGLSPEAIERLKNG
jgi:phage terminase large subunit-like protein